MTKNKNCDIDLLIRTHTHTHTHRRQGLKFFHLGHTELVKPTSQDERETLKSEKNPLQSVHSLPERSQQSTAKQQHCHSTYMATPKCDHTSVTKNTRSSTSIGWVRSCRGGTFIYFYLVLQGSGSTHSVQVSQLPRSCSILCTGCTFPEVRAGLSDRAKGHESGGAPHNAHHQQAEGK